MPRKLALSEVMHLGEHLPPSVSRYAVYCDTHDGLIELWMTRLRDGKKHTLSGWLDDPFDVYDRWNQLYWELVLRDQLDFHG